MVVIVRMKISFPVIGFTSLLSTVAGTVSATFSTEVFSTAAFSVHFSGSGLWGVAMLIFWGLFEITARYGSFVMQAREGNV